MSKERYDEFFEGAKVVPRTEPLIKVDMVKYGSPNVKAPKEKKSA